MAIAWRTGDVFNYAPDPPPDFVVTSQFTHHLGDADVVRFLRWLEAHAGRGWVIAVPLRWLTLFFLLPFGFVLQISLSEAAIAVPPWPKFLRGCVRYRESLERQRPDAPVHDTEFGG